MTEENPEELASRVSYEIIKDIAPKELALFDDYRESFEKDPGAFTQKNRKKEKALGFAFPDGTSQILTTVVLPLVSQAIKDFTARKQGKKPSNDELKEMRTQAYNNAIAMGVSKEKAEVMADALVGKMAMLSK
ncbi:MAG TPA: hypothetical protein VEC08_00405 [Nitrososphaerales archaeon]|nr:hypothetical protein [Nitrososphaerales archaeon]